MGGDELRDGEAMFAIGAVENFQTPQTILPTELDQFGQPVAKGPGEWRPQLELLSELGYSL